MSGNVMWDGTSPITYGLIGRKLGHSWSPVIHERLGSVPYVLIEREPNQVRDFVANGAWRGLNVTIPYKQDAAQLADVRSNRVERLGVANTLVRQQDGTILADNTDILGFAWMLERFANREFGKTASELLAAKSVLVFGSGGASQAIRAALEDVRARVSVISRTGADTYETLLERHGDAVLIVNTTPVGMYPNCPASPVTKDILSQMKSLVGVLDVVYNPTRTGICLDAEELGIANESGLAMLVGQALFASELFQERELDHALATDILDDIHASTGNIVLIGMPGSGKSSCGRQLGKICGREHIDLDDAFTERFGKSPADVIRESGEDEFRGMETEVLSTYASRSGLVLSTGGGVVTRPENYRLMHQNGTIVMLDRPLNELSSKGRPISQASGVEELARKRMPLYRTWADLVVSCTGSARGDALEIIRRLNI